MSTKWTDALVGKTVVGLYVSEEETALRFRCADGTEVVWVTEGDCCSESWWADGFHLDALRGATVLRAEEIDMPDYDVNDGRGRQDEDEVYGVRIDTERGTATLAFRNSSNGYYGGWAELENEWNRQAWNWREIPGDDWQA